MQSKGAPPILDYTSPAGRNTRDGSSASIVAGAFCGMAMVAAFIGDLGFGTTNDFGAGLVFGLVILLSWSLASVGILISLALACQSRGSRGLFTLFLGVSVLCVSIVVTHFLRGPSLSGAGLH